MRQKSRDLTSFSEKRTRIWKNFQHRTTPFFVIFQTYSDDVNFIVPSNRLYFLKRKFNSLLENEMHFVNIVRKRGSSLYLSIPFWQLLRVVFLNIVQLHFFPFFKRILIMLTVKCPLFGYIFWKRNLTFYSKMGCILSISGGNGAQLYLCLHPLRRLLRVF